MCGISPRKFEKILHSNGWEYIRMNGSHKSYRKSGVNYIVTFPCKGKEISRPLVERLIKEAQLVI